MPRVGPRVALRVPMRTDISSLALTATCTAAQCIACHGPLESHRQTVLDRYAVELWWCQHCNIWWGSGSAQHDTSDRADFCRTHPVALAARVDRLTSIYEPAVRARS